MLSINSLMCPGIFYRKNHQTNGFDESILDRFLDPHESSHFIETQYMTNKVDEINFIKISSKKMVKVERYKYVSQSITAGNDSWEMEI